MRVAWDRDNHSKSTANQEELLSAVKHGGFARIPLPFPMQDSAASEALSDVDLLQAPGRELASAHSDVGDAATALDGGGGPAG